MSVKKWIAALAVIAATSQFSPSFAACRDDSCGEENSCGFDWCNMCDPCEGWSIYADWIYWRTRRCDLDYAVNAPSTDEFTGKIHEVHPDWESGFRVGIMKSCGDMDIGVRYTYLRVKEDDSVFSGDDELAATRIGPLDSGTELGDFELAEAEFKLDYDVIDVEAGFNMEITECLHGRLFGGLRFAFIDQKFDILYADDADDPLDGDADIVEHKLDMDGYGLYLGAKAAYAFNDCIKIFGGFAYGILVSDFERHFKHIEFDDDDDSETHIDLKDDCWRLVSTVDLAIGIKYELCNFLCADWMIGVGYEFHQYINTSNFLSIVTTGEEDEDDASIRLDHHLDNLGFDGVFVRVGAKF